MILSHAAAMLAEFWNYVHNPLADNAKIKIIAM